VEVKNVRDRDADGLAVIEIVHKIQKPGKLNRSLPGVPFDAARLMFQLACCSLYSLTSCSISSLR
jgi:hypothetical protein